MPRTLGQGAAFLFGFWLALWLLVPLSARAENSDLVELEAGLHAEVNAARERHHLVPLHRDSRVDAVAAAHSRDMVRRAFFSHINPEGENPPARLERAGLSGFALAAENVGMTSRGAPNREIVTGWLASPIHRKNLLASAFNITGVGIARAPNGTLYYTQLYLSVPRDEP